MTEWLVEEGIGEDRAVLVENDRIVAARLHWPGGLVAGQVEDGRLISRAAGSPRGTARFPNGEEALVDNLPPAAAEGAIVRLEVRRASVREGRRTKLARARPATLPLRPAPTLAEQLAAEGQAARVVSRFPRPLEWDELWSEAREGRVGFAGGDLLLYPTPAMLLIDIDGEGSSFDLARAAVEPLAAALGRFDLAGNIGIDFPTLTQKAQRKAVDERLMETLGGWPHERTAMNGFGFVQIVARLERPSLVALLANDPAGAEARRLLRQAEGLAGAGTVLLRCGEMVATALRPAWVEALRKRMGRAVRVEVDRRLDVAGAHAQLVTDG